MSSLKTNWENWQDFKKYCCVWWILASLGYLRVFFLQCIPIWDGAVKCVFGFRKKTWISLMSIDFLPAAVHKQRLRSAVFQKNVPGHGHGWDKGGGTWSTWEDKDNSLSPSPNSEIWAWWKLEGLWNPVRGFSLLYFGSAALGNCHCLACLGRLHLLPGFNCACLQRNKSSRQTHGVYLIRKSLWIKLY